MSMSITVSPQNLRQVQNFLQKRAIIEISDHEGNSVTLDDISKKYAMELAEGGGFEVTTVVLPNQTRVVKGEIVPDVRETLVLRKVL